MPSNKTHEIQNVQLLYIYWYWKLRRMKSKPVKKERESVFLPFFIFLDDHVLVESKLAKQYNTEFIFLNIPNRKLDSSPDGKTGL
jgi:hypothetical protein